MSLVYIILFQYILSTPYKIIAFFIIVIRGSKTNELQKPFKNSDFFQHNFNKHFLHNKGY